MKIALSVFLTCAVIAMVISFAPIKTVAYDVMVYYQETETYYENEPYEVVETYYETQPIDQTTPEEEETTDLPIRVATSYDVIEARSKYEMAYVTLRNTDNVAGTFTVSFSFQVTTLNYHYYYDYPYVETHWSQAQKNIYLEPNEKGTVKASAKYYEATSTMTWSYSVGPDIQALEESFQRRLDEVLKNIGGDDSINGNGDGIYSGIRDLVEKYGYPIATEETRKNLPEELFEKKPLTVDNTKYRLVEKERTVTKYRQVEKQRTVTKQRPETRYKKVSILDYILHY